MFGRTQLTKNGREPPEGVSRTLTVEQHFNHIDETLASWKRRRISRPAMNLRLTIPPTVI